MARDAHNRHARTFALVYNESYKFGVEGAGAFRAQVQRDGGTLDSSCIVPLQAGSTSYKDQVNSFNSQCGLGSSHPVDFVALLLEPQTAETWLQDGPYMGLRSDGSGEGAGGPQPLFDDNFGNACGQICTNMQVWTSFYPPLFPYDQKPAVTTFKQDLCTVDSNCSVDADSAFTEGGYVGMQLLVTSLQALAKQNLAVTRQALRAQLDSTTLDVGLSGPLTFRRGNHAANQSMVAFRDTDGQQFSGFQVVSDQPLVDPCPGCKDPSI
jgi:ABC-type branched-subunit amino acid transport system substrate-binding protein